MKTWTALISLGVIGGFAASAVADNDHRHDNKRRVFRTQLASYNEVPSLSTTGRGQFYAVLNQRGDELRYWLTFSGLSANVTQSHIHFGQHHTTGGIIVWLCEAPPPAPQSPSASTPACSGTESTVSGVLTRAEVIGPAGQDIPAGAFDELVAAMRAGAAYVNVHSGNYLPGEIRGQVD